MLANECFICPFCAYSGKLIDFIIKGQKYTGKSFQCPDCKQVMRRNTLLRSVTPREWGMWLYASIRVWNKHGDAFYDRIKKEPDGKFVLAKRLYNMGEDVADEFWGGWKEAKDLSMNRLKHIVDNAYIPERRQSKLVRVDAKRPSD